jgi:hypothetical protein
MIRIVLCSLAMTGLAFAQPQLPAKGSNLPPNGALGWGSFAWLYDNPAMTDAAGKVVIHWFCAPKIQACSDDLARVLTLRESSNRVYVIAYINGSKRDAQKLDPIRGSEGVGRGTVAFGKGVTTLMKQLGITGPASFVVDPDSKVQHVTMGGSPGELDARDGAVRTLAAGIKDYVPSFDGPDTVAAGAKFQLAITIKLASWLVYNKKPGARMGFQLTAPKDIKCDNTVLGAGQLKTVNQTLTATVTCSGPKGSYEVRGQINFSYVTPTGAPGIGSDGKSWKFVIK